MGFDAMAWGRFLNLTCSAGVGEAQDFLRTVRRRDREQRFGLDESGRLVPWPSWHRSEVERIKAMSQTRRHNLPNRREGTHRGFLDTCPRNGSSLESNRQGDHLVIIEQQGRALITSIHAVAADWPHRRLDVVTHLPEPVDIAPNRPLADTESVSENRTWPVTSSLQQRQQLQ